jgi:hypothetical protein
MDLYCEPNGFCILTLGFLYGYQNDPMIDIMIFRDSNKIEFKSFLLVFLWESVENFNMF